MLGRWALELQQFNIKFQHIQDKRNLVADAISWLRTLGLHQDNDNEDIPLTTEDVVENIIEEVHITEVMQKTPTYNVQKLNLDVLRKKQQHNWFCKNKVKEMKTKLYPNFLPDKNSILRKVVKLNTVEPTIVVPRKLTSPIIFEFHNAKGYQGISCTVNMMRHYFWWIGMWRDVHQHINNCKVCTQFLPNRVYMQPMHPEIPQSPFASCAMDNIGPLPMSSKGHRHALTFICLLTSYLITVPLNTKMVEKVSMAYIKEILPKTSCPKFILQNNGTELRNER